MCQWPSSQPLSFPQLSHKDSLWALGITKSHREQGLDYRKGEELSWCPSWSNSLWQGWRCGLVHWLGRNATDPIWRVLASSDGISSWTPLKFQHSIPSWLSVQWEPSACRSCECCQKKGSSEVCGWICSVWPSWVWESQHASTGNSFGLWVIEVDPVSSHGIFSKFKTILLHIILLKSRLHFWNLPAVTIRL